MRRKFDCMGITVHLGAGNHKVKDTISGDVLCDYNVDRRTGYYEVFMKTVRNDAYKVFGQKSKRRAA